MKRLLAILLSLSLLCLVVLAAACGDNPGDETTSGTTPSEQTSGTTGSDSPDETTGSGEETSGTDENRTHRRTVAVCVKTNFHRHTDGL